MSKRHPIEKNEEELSDAYPIRFYKSDEAAIRLLQETIGIPIAVMVRRTVHTHWREVLKDIEDEIAEYRKQAFGTAQEGRSPGKDKGR